jgi:hypothetical protein
MIEKIKQAVEIWKSLPVLPRRMFLFIIFGGQLAYLVIRVMVAIQSPESIMEMSLWEFLGLKKIGG